LVVSFSPLESQPRIDSCEDSGAAAVSGMGSEDASQEKKLFLLGADTAA
jgi:hypothetical protein